MKRNFMMICLSLFSLFTIGQTEIRMNITFGEEPLKLNQYYSFTKSDSISLETVRFYVSNIVLYKNDSLVRTYTDRYFLIDVANDSSMSIKLDDEMVFTHVKFDVGIDSATNLNGAMGGVLDPMYGMYWSWQSGYVNIKIEGASTLCNTRKGKFTFHLGGYQDEFNAIQTVVTSINASKEISLNLETFFVVNDLSKTNTIMSPSKQAVAVAKSFAHLFIDN